MKKTYIQLIGAGVVLIAVVVVYLIAYGTVSSGSAQISSVEQQVKQQSLASTRIAEAKTELATLAPEEAEINQYFISTNDLVPFLEQLAAIGQYYGATVNVLSVSATPGTPFGSIALSLTISGPFNSVMRTLGTIEYGPYDITTNSVTFDSTGSGSSTTWTASGTFTLGALAQGQVISSGGTTTSSVASVPTQSTPEVTSPQQTEPAASTNSSSTPVTQPAATSTSAQASSTVSAPTPSI